jgi:L,D-transpeptidase catalytic domain.
MTLYAIDGKNTVIAKYPVGIGKGPLWKPKRSMSDYITPTGEFTVEMILSKNSDLNAIDSSFHKRYQSSSRFLNLINSKPKLAQLFKNMNSIDFNRNGAPDNAYGTGYISLTSENAVTGPKMRTYPCGHLPYWYSIAIHGTPDPEKAIGHAASGGCVHLGEDALMKLIGEKFVKVGTRVTIADAPPS